MSNLKKYNIFVFLSSFSKGLIEIFFPLLLLNHGYKLKEILFFYCLLFTIIEILIPIVSFLLSKTKAVFLMFLSSFFFIATYYYLKLPFFSIYILAFLSAVYQITYWIGRHTYALKIIEDKKTTNNVSSYAIISILAFIPSAIIGSYILENISYNALLTILFILSTLSLIPILKIKTKRQVQKIQIKEIIKSFPIKNYLFLFIDQFKYIGVLLFPIYIYINISKTFSFIGILSVLTGISSAFFIYFISKKMEKNKKDYLKISLVILSLIWLVKINTNTKLFLSLVVLIEGLFKSSTDTIILRNTYAYGKNYKSVPYIIFIEIISSFFKIIIFLLFITLKLNIMTILYIGAFSIFINAFIGFDDGKYGYSNHYKKTPTTLFKKT